MRDGNSQTEIEWRGISLAVRFDYFPAEPRNGLPSPAVEVAMVIPRDEDGEEGPDDIADFLTEEAFGEIAEILLAKAREEEAA